MNKGFKIISILLCALLILPSSEALYIADTVYTEQNHEVNDKKIYCNASLEEDFADNRVLVVLDQTVGAINKKHQKNFFGFNGITDIKDLTEITRNEKVDTIVQEENFRQIIQLELSTHSKKRYWKLLNIWKK